MIRPLARDAAAIVRFRDDLSAVWPEWAQGGRLLVAVSGGPDSTALLLLAQALLGERCLAATVDHGLRPESAAEAAIVAATCDRLGIAHATLAGALPVRAGRTANVSARARLLRYRLLEQHLIAAGAARLATAHHADDQLETLVMRLNRGAGVAGLAGVRARRGRVIRPLLGWRRADLAAVVADGGVMAIHDPSNVDERFDRARVRRALGSADWLDAVKWGRSAAALGDAEAALDWAAQRFIGERGQAGDDGSVVLLFGTEAVPWEIARRAFLLALRQVDAAIEVKGAELTRLVAAMLSHDPSAAPCATLGRVRVEAQRDGAGGRVYAFRPAPPPRAH